ncbi:hypothetical protein [Streptosporangium saharense]|uniref:hypothetical protein n=1 Tax=Streptosporangium saharense TaxID=1706840 RepID=UPI003327A9F2
MRARPLTVDQLAAALDRPVPWTAALDAIGRRPALSDPLTVEQTGHGAFAVTPSPDRLSPALLPHVGEVPPPGGGRTRGR